MIIMCQHPDGCERPAETRGWCGAHFMRLWSKGDVGSAEIGLPAHLAPPRRGADSPSWVGDQITYSGAHIRVRHQRGKASAHTCQHCDEQALHWAYDNTDPNELVDDRGYRYSCDSARYIPLCVPCHSQFDAAERHMALVW